jgi:tetratricopeptide (TPR) repeat protein
MNFSRSCSFLFSIFIFLLFLPQPAAYSKTQEENNVQTATKIIEECYNNGKLDLLNNLVAGNYSEPKNELRGPDLLKYVIVWNRSRRPDFKVTVKDIFAEKEKVIVHYGYDGFDVVSQAPLNFDGVYVLEFERGKVVSGNNIFDSRHVLERMDYAILPPSRSAEMNRATFLDSMATKLFRANEIEYAAILYEKAIDLDPTLYYPYAGLATIQIIQGQTLNARKTLHQCYDKVKTLQQKRYTCYLVAATYFEDGDMQEALIEMDRALVHARHSNSIEQVISWYNTMSTVWRELGELEKAGQLQNERLEIVKESDLPLDVKENYRGDVLWNRVNNALLLDDLVMAKKAAEEFMTLDIEEDPRATPNYSKIQGVLMLHEKKYKDAVKFYESVYQSPLNFRRLAKAYEGAGDTMNAGRTWYKTAHFNVPSLPWLLMRKEAEAKVAHWARE